MSFKTFMKSACATYFIIVTLVNLAAFAVGSIFRPGEQFGYEAFLTPLLYGFLGLLPMCVMYSKKEMTGRQILIRKILQFILLEALLLGLASGQAAFSKENLGQTVSFALSVFIVFVLVHVISFLLDIQQARQMTKDLLSWQAKQEPDL